MSKEDQVKNDFEKACNDIKLVTNLDIDNDTLLVLYGLFKQANEGDCTTTKPSFLDPKGQAKWNSWNENKSLDQITAMRRYVRKVKNILGK
jgi:diazepam-binding inhibitor (GABA receptor modulating acyl-CoA-binding protein)